MCPPPALIPAPSCSARSLGYDDFGFANDNQIKTPTFNSLHDEGIALSQYYVQPSCSPTRATFLTGRKPVHTGVNVWIPNLPYGLPLNETTLAQVLNARGFVSHAVGKVSAVLGLVVLDTKLYTDNLPRQNTHRFPLQQWHLGCHLTPFLPTFRGFDSFYGYYEGSEDYFTHNFYGNGLDFHREEGRRCGANCTELLWDAVGQYSTTLFSQRAVQLIADHNADPVSDGKPLFLYLAYQGVHEPAQAPQSYVDAYNETGPSGFIADKRRRLFAGMLSALDEGLANVTGALKANTHSDGTSMFDETLFIVSECSPLSRRVGYRSGRVPYTDNLPRHNTHAASRCNSYRQRRTNDGVLYHRTVKLAAARVEVLHLGGVSGCRWHAVSWPAPRLLAPVLTLPTTHPPSPFSTVKGYQGRRLHVLERSTGRCARAGLRWADPRRRLAAHDRRCCGCDTSRPIRHAATGRAGHVGNADDERGFASQGSLLWSEPGRWWSGGA